MDKNKTILIVDDIEINRMLLAEIFNDDYNIVEACNGAEAIEIMNGQEFSALLLDVIMPEVNGIGVLEEMNRSGKIEKIPVFLIHFFHNKLQQMSDRVCCLLLFPFLINPLTFSSHRIDIQKLFLYHESPAVQQIFFQTFCHSKDLFKQQLDIMQGKIILIQIFLK